jgi:hypothetical protein
MAAAIQEKRERRHGEERSDASKEVPQRSLDLP